MKYGVLFLILFLSTRCEIFTSYVSLHIIIPPLPESWQGIDVDFYEIRWWDNEIRTMDTSSDQVALKIPKVIGLSVSITPIYKGIALFPAAAIFPYDLIDHSHLFPTWHRGALGNLLLLLLAQSFPVYRLNIERFITDYEIFEDPWEIDHERVIQSILNSQFFAPVVRARDVGEVVVETPPGLWIPCNPFHSRLHGTQHLLLDLVSVHRWVGISQQIVLSGRGDGAFLTTVLDF